MPNLVTYSLCPFGTGTIETGAGTITITSGVATLSVEQTGNIGMGVNIEYNSLHAYIAPNRIGFDSGGTAELLADTKIAGATSGATGIVRFVELTSGTWAGADAAGWIYFESTTGTFQNNEEINRTKPTTSNSIATVNGTIEGNIGNGNTQFVVKTATGGTPSNQTATAVTSIHHEYASLSDFEAGFIDSSHINNTSLVATDVVAHACCYYDHNDYTADSSTVTIDFGITDSTRRLIIHTPVGGAESRNNQRHAGQWDTNKYRLSASIGSAIVQSTSGCTIDGLQLEITHATAAQKCILQSGGGSSGTAKITNNFIRGVGGSGYSFGIYSNADASSVTKVWNNIICDITSHASGAGIRLYYGKTPVSTVDFFYNTMCVNVTGIRRSGNTLNVINTAVFNNTDDFDGTIGATYSVSDDTQAGTGNIDWDNGSTDWGNVFSDHANRDFRLENYTVSGIAVIEQGSDLAASEGIWRDIAGNERGSSPDIGAFEYVSTGVTLTVSPLAHGHALDVLGLTQQHTLAMQALLHNHAIDNVALITAIELAISSLLHGHALDAAVLDPVNNFANDPHCKALWRFESGGLITDSKGSNTLINNNTVTEDTTNYMEGACSASFDSANTEYFNITDANLDSGFPLKSGSSSPEFTWLGWFNPATVTTFMCLWGKYDAPGDNRSAKIQVTDTAAIRLLLGHTNGTAYEAFELSRTLVATQDYHVAVTYKDSDRSYKIRLWDDTASAVYSTSGTATNNISLVSTDFLIGNSSGVLRYFNGRIDEAVVFDRVLLDTEIDAIRKGMYGVDSISVTNLMHSHAIDNITLLTVIELIVSGLLHGHDIDALGLTQQNLLSINALAHTHTLDAPGLTQQNVLVINALIHSHGLDASTLVPINNFTNDPHCRALWRFESGALTTDTIGTNTLTNNNTVTEDTTNFMEGSCSASFDPANTEYFNISDTNLNSGFPLKSGDSSPEFTVLCWFNIADSIGSNIACFSKYETTENKRSLLIGTDGASRNPVVYFGHSNGTGYETKTINHVCVTGRDYHMAVTYKDSDRSYKMRLWDDTGESVYSSFGTTTNNISVTTAMVAIGSGGTWGQWFDGRIDETLVFDRVLLDSEIDAIRKGVYGVDSISVSSLTHTHTIDNVTLITTIELVMSSLLHGHNLDNIGLTQANTLAVAALSHGHGMDNVELSQAYLLAVDALLHAQSIGNVSLTQQHVLAIAEMLHTQSLNNIDLSQAHNLIVSGLTHSHTLDNVALSMAISLVVESLTHGHGIDNISLTQAHQLAVDALLHAQDIDNIDLSQANILSVQSLVHSQTIDNIALSLATILSVASLIHAHGIDNINLVQAHQLAVDALNHTQDFDGVDLAQQNTLSIASLIHSHDLDNVTLSTAILLSIDSLLHSHALDNTDLTQAHSLIVDALTHAHGIDNINIMQAHLLSIQGLLHGHSLDNIMFGTIPTAQYRQALELIARTTSYALVKRKTDYEII